ncbi:MAG: hypothetical protein AB7W37_08795 [Syntrophobacteraceae bacterium]|jgi:uncharacterized membrane protein HdeD (DUF308 family)
MNRMFEWVSLAAGIGLVLVGIRSLHQQGDWIPLILGALIIAFGISGLLKGKPKA